MLPNSLTVSLPWVMRDLFVAEMPSNCFFAACAISLTFETVLLFWIVRQRLGLHVLAFGK